MTGNAFVYAVAEIKLRRLVKDIKSIVGNQWSTGVAWPAAIAQTQMLASCLCFRFTQKIRFHQFFLFDTSNPFVLRTPFQFFLYAIVPLILKCLHPR